MGKKQVPAIPNVMETFEQTQKRMQATKPETDLVVTDIKRDLTDFDNALSLEDKEKKIITWAKIGNITQFAMMVSIGTIVTEAQYLVKWVIRDGKREQDVGDYDDPSTYMDHLSEITGYSRHYIGTLVRMYRVYLKYKSFLDTIDYVKVANIGKIAYLDKAFEMIESGELTKAQLKKVLLEGTESELSDVISRQLVVADQEFTMSPTAKITTRKNSVMIDDVPAFTIEEGAEGVKENLTNFLQSEKKKAALGDAFKETTEYFQNKLYECIKSEKIPVIIPVDSDIPDIDSFRRAAEKAMNTFYKEYKASH